jgi:hypothetical protein
MSMPSVWPLSITRGPYQKADILLDTTCFSSADLDNLSNFDTDSDTDSDVDSHHLFFDLANPTGMPRKEIQNAETHAEVFRRKALSNSALDSQARYYHPTFPPPSFLSTLLQPDRFKEYIANEFPSITLNSQSPRTTNQEPLRKEVNATMANSLLNTVIPTSIATLDWIRSTVFPDEHLPVPFDDKCLDNVGECWDLSSQQFSHFPEATIEQTVQDWLNHLAHTLGVKHNLIQKMQPEELMSAYEDEKEVDGDGNHGGAGIRDSPYVGVEEDTLDNGVEEAGFVVAKAQDRSFSMASYKHGPSGGYRLCKPDLILLNRNVRQFLKKHNLRPRWHHVEAILEVSSSASRESMVTQILEKTSLMFEAQPFRRFAVGLAIRGTFSKKLEFCFLLVDRSGVCITEWQLCSGYEGISLARIIFALSYAKPELLGIDTSMTMDLISGNVTKIKVQDQEFHVVKHIHSSLVLFGRGTHIFLVQGEDGRFHIVKDAWLLVNHGISEITVLSQINDILEKDSTEDAKTYRSMHPRFIVGEEIGDSTKARRGRLTHTSPDRVHRRVVTGPVGDPLCSFRSREEFVQVLLDCVKWLEFLHTKCKIVHGDLSINNIVIYRAPLACPPASTLKKGTTMPTNPNMTTRVTQNIALQHQASVVPAPLAGLDESIPVVGTVIDYDYARSIDTIMEKTSGTLPFMPLAALHKSNRGKYIHGPAHDLESLLQTALGVVTFTNGPCGNFRAPTDHVPMARWYNEIDREQLCKDKTIDLLTYNLEIEGHFTEYWKPFSPYLRRLVSATWPDRTPPMSSQASHKVFKDILEEALKALKTLAEVPAKYAPNSQKRARTVNNDEGRYPYKYSRGGSPLSERIPRPANIKELSQWQDSRDA